MSSELIIEKLNTKKHNRKIFDCGNHVLNTYLKKQASQDQKKNLAVVYVATDSAGERDKKVHGFYTLSSYSIDFEKVEAKHVKHVSYETIPCVLIGRLAINKEPKKVYGFELLGHALMNVKKMAAQLGIRLVLVDAKDDSAREFYRRNGFFDLLDNNNSLYFPISSIEF